MAITQFTTQGLSCHVCGDGQSYPNKFIRNFIIQLKNVEDVKYEWMSEWSKPYRYDAYFKYLGKEYIIEADGGWHFQYNTMSGKTKKSSKEVDELKNQLAIKHNIEIIRIDCSRSNYEFISANITKSRLADIFDLGNIDWIKCDELAQKSMVKRVCDYHNDYPNKTHIEIGDEFRINEVTVRRYLRKGKRFGWCEYNPMSMEERLNKAISSNSKIVDVFGLDGNYLRSYPSIRECHRKMTEEYETCFPAEKIRMVCENEIQSYKKFIFKYHMSA